MSQAETKNTRKLPQPKFHDFCQTNDVCAMRLYKVEKYGPLSRLIFTVDKTSAEGEEHQEPIVTLLVPTEIISDMIMTLTGQPLPQQHIEPIAASVH